MGALSVIEEQGLTLLVIKLWAEDKTIPQIQVELKKAGVELSDVAVWNFVSSKVKDPKYKQAVETAQEVFRRKLRTDIVQQVINTHSDVKRLLDGALGNINEITLTEDNAKALELVDKMMQRWLDRLTKISKMPEFAAGPSTAVQVNTFNSDSQSLRLMKLLQDVSRFLPPDKQSWLYAELDKLDGSKAPEAAPPTGDSKSNVVDAEFHTT